MTVTDAYRYKGGMRIHLLAAEEAFARVQSLGEGIVSLSALLSAKPHPDAVLAAAERLLSENRDGKHLLAEANTACNEMLCRLLPKGKPLCFFDSRRDVTALRHLALRASEAVGDAVLVLGEDGEGSYRFVLCGENVKPLYERLSETLTCRGGGNDRMICGSLSASRQALEAAVGDHFSVIVS